MWREVALGVLLAVAGCSSYKPARNPEPIPGMSDGTSSNEVIATDESVEVRLVPLFDKEMAKSYLGIDPAKSKMMPALVKVVNTSSSPIKMDLENSYLAVDPNEHWCTLALGEAIHRGLRSDAEVVGWMLAFGVPAWYAAAGHAANVNRTLEEDYHEKHFKPMLINGGASGQGVVFFDVPENDARHVSAAVIRIQRLSDNACKDVRLALDQDVLVRP
jgi:hypothetical protein